MHLVRTLKGLERVEIMSCDGMDSKSSAMNQSRLQRIQKLTMMKTFQKPTNLPHLSGTQQDLIKVLVPATCPQSPMGRLNRPAMVSMKAEAKNENVYLHDDGGFEVGQAELGQL